MKKVEWPFADEREKIRLQEVLDSHEWWRGAGRMVKEFEQKFADFHQAKYALGVFNNKKINKTTTSILMIINIPYSIKLILFYNK